jgi:carbonic anhydrase/acetyltransferase-like protein (isoleucine patch superfamily)
VIVHISPAFTTRIGRRVTLGHGAILHSATVEDFAVIGIGATLANRSIVGRWSIVGEAALVASGQAVPAESIAVGQPARIIGPIRDRHRQHWQRAKEHYVGLVRRNRKGLVKESH